MFLIIWLPWVLVEAVGAFLSVFSDLRILKRQIITLYALIVRVVSYGMPNNLS